MKKIAPFLLPYRAAKKGCRKNWVEFSLYRHSVVASNYKSVSMVIAERGLNFRAHNFEKIQANSHSISFDDEWTKFAFLVASHTQDGLKYRPFPLNAADAWNKHFEKVISNAGNLHQSHESFSSLLFEALRDSLDNFVYPCDDDKRNLIILQSTGMNIGFGSEVHRTKLGVKKEYGLSMDSRTDHGCYVFGTSRHGTHEPNEFYDLTAVVELKLESESCLGFAVDKTATIEPPNFTSGHGPMGQAMIYSLDMWHCLARRGVSVKSIPVVVLAGKSETAKSSRLCCLEAQINVPDFCGNAFIYSVERIVPFDETSGILPGNQTADASVVRASKNSRDKRALAIYIRTMRIGLERAIEVSKKRSSSNYLSPVSLCCRSLLMGTADAMLVASPIPRENHLIEQVMKIHQGELFQLSRPTKSSFSGIKRILWFVDLTVKQDDAELTDSCLVKVSCLSVHKTYVPLYLCDKALSLLHGACHKLKEVISKVLLGYSSTNDISLVLIMNDLRKDNFTVLNHKNVRFAGKLPELWKAFCYLVKSLLLPMAMEDVIHVDIRSTFNDTYNILCRYHPSHEIELCLIDFDSLILFSSLDKADLVRQDTAVFWKDIKGTVVNGTNWESAYRYLFWQIIWLAYTWYPAPSSSVTLGSEQEEPNAHVFVHFLFADDRFVDFKNWLGHGNVAALRQLMAEETKGSTIEDVLNILENVFTGSILTD